MLGSSLVVDRVLVGDGSSDGSKRVIENGKLYGATGLQGGNDSIWPISAKSLHISISSLAALSKIALSTMKTEQKVHLQKGLLTNLLEWMQKNKGVPVVIGAVGARGHISNTRQFQVRKYGPNVLCRNEGSCVPESVANGVAALSSTTDGLSVMNYFEKNPRFFTTLKQLFDLLPHLPVGITIRKVPKAQRTVFDANPFSWLSNLKKGVWIVRLKQHRIVDHCVAVDANRAIILDSAARYPFILCEEILRRLGGDQADTLQVAEVRKLLLQNRKHKKRTGKKSKRE